MAIEIRPLIGLRRGTECDTGLDQVFVVDAVHPDGWRIGLVARTPGAPLQLLEHGVSESVIAEATKALGARDASGDPRPHHPAPPEIEGTEDEDE